MDGPRYWIWRCGPGASGPVIRRESRRDTNGDPTVLKQLTGFGESRDVVRSQQLDGLDLERWAAAVIIQGVRLPAGRINSARYNE
jgi:hypothetical protein